MVGDELAAPDQTVFLVVVAVVVVAQDMGLLRSVLRFNFGLLVPVNHSARIFRMFATILRLFHF